MNLKSPSLKSVTFALKPPPTLYWKAWPSPYGKLLLGFGGDGTLYRLGFLGQRSAATAQKEWRRVWPKTSFVKAPRALKNPAASSPKVCLVGTKFQHKVWKALLEIGSGEVISYAALARRIGKPKAARAVGAALGKNPVPLLIPCHRVIAQNGALGGYNGGLKIKAALLEKELHA
ncbi:MAG: methylated-DNA--[protein]-cysteine S-methyltransferase [Alphaproteobacteria bacterium]|nr:methylated-DNA--[protein]-cysteine S-methyltransferase [Alphaproteobacteria bacterium]